MLFQWSLLTLSSVIFKNVYKDYTVENPQVILDFPSECACWALCFGDESCAAFTVHKNSSFGVTCSFSVGETPSCQHLEEFYTKESPAIVPQRNAVTYCKISCLEKQKLGCRHLIVSPLGDYQAGKKFCFHNDATPFVPKTKEEYDLYVEHLTGLDGWGWFPLNDFQTNGVPIYEDGTDYKNAPFNPTVWDPSYPNTERRKCVTLGCRSQAAWSECGHDYEMVCQKNECVE